jgi:Tol biopolymer transport system component
MIGAFAASRPLADRGRLLVSVGSTFHLIEPDGSTLTRSLTPLLGNSLDGGFVPASAEPCSSIIPGTDVVSWHDRYRMVQFASIEDPAARFAGVATNFAWAEEWSPHRRHMLLVQPSVVTAVDLTDPRRPERRRFEVGSLGGAALDPDGRVLVVALRTLGHITLQVLDAASGESRSQVAAQVIAPSPADGAPLSMSLSPDGSLVAIQENDGSDAVMVDAATGASRDLPRGAQVTGARWSPDGRWLAMPTTWDGVWLVPRAGGEPVHLVREGGRSPRRLAWSPDGSRLAFGYGPAALVTVAADGSRWTEQPVLGGSFTWSPDRTLVVARRSADGEAVLVERLRSDGAAPAEWIATLPGPTSDADGALCIEWASGPVAP